MSDTGKVLTACVFGRVPLELWQDPPAIAAWREEVLTQRLRDFAREKGTTLVGDPAEQHAFFAMVDAPDEEPPIRMIPVSEEEALRPEPPVRWWDRLLWALRLRQRPEPRPPVVVDIIMRCSTHAVAD